MWFVCSLAGLQTTAASVKRNCSETEEEGRRTWLSQSCTAAVVSFKSTEVVLQGRIVGLYPSGTTNIRAAGVDLKHKMLLPTFADLHTHIGQRLLPWTIPPLSSYDLLLDWPVKQLLLCLSSNATGSTYTESLTSHQARSCVPLWCRQGSYLRAQPEPRRQPQRRGPQHSQRRGVLGLRGRLPTYGLQP